MYAACMNAIRDSVQEQSCVVHSLPCALSASDSPNMTAAPSQQHDNVRMSMHSQACTCMSASVRHFGSAHQANTFWRCSVLTTYMVFRPSALLSGACQHTRRSQSHTAYTQDHLSVWAAAAILPKISGCTPLSLLHDAQILSTQYQGQAKTMDSDEHTWCAMHDHQCAQTSDTPAHQVSLCKHKLLEHCSHHGWQSNAHQADAGTGECRQHAGNTLAVLLLEGPPTDKGYIGGMKADTYVLQVLLQHRAARGLLAPVGHDHRGASHDLARLALSVNLAQLHSRANTQQMTCWHRPHASPMMLCRASWHSTSSKTAGVGSSSHCVHLWSTIQKEFSSARGLFPREYTLCVQSGDMAQVQDDFSPAGLLSLSMGLYKA